MKKIVALIISLFICGTVYADGIDLRESKNASEACHTFIKQSQTPIMLDNVTTMQEIICKDYPDYSSTMTVKFIINRFYIPAPSNIPPQNRSLDWFLQRKVNIERICALKPPIGLTVIFDYYDENHDYLHETTVKVNGDCVKSI